MRAPSVYRPMRPVIALDQQVIHAVDATGLDRRRRQPGCRRQPHAESFVEDDAVEAFDGGFEDVRAWRAAERQGNFVAFDADGDLVLRAGEREAYPFVAGQERALGKLFQDRGKFDRRERTVAVMLFGQLFACRNESNGAGALTADLLQHGVVVARADAEIACDEFALCLFGQYAAEEASALVAREALFAQGQRLRERRRAGPVQPALGIGEAHLATIVLDELAGEVVVQIDIERPRHLQSSFFVVAVVVVVAGSVRVSLIPSVCKTLSALPISQVSLPRSKSMTKRSPVPDVSARSFWVTPSFLRVSRIIRPICCDVYFKVISAGMLPYGNIRAFFS